MAKIGSYLVDRLGLEDVIAHAKKKTVPLHNQTAWYYWGGISLFCFLLQAVTGVLLMVYYRPGPEAYESVRQLTYEIHFGWLIRSMHVWAASAFLLSVFIHMFTVYFMRAYRRPREIGWWSGILLLLLGLTFGFSGYLLPMDDLAFFATKVGLEVPASIPLIGQPIADLLRGGLEVTEFTVQRFFALHAVVLPLLYLPLLGVHLWLVQKHGNALPPSEEEKPESERKSMPFFPNFLAKDLAMWLITLNVIALMAAAFPWQLGPMADPLAPAPVGIKPEWFFMSPYAVLKLLGNLFPGMAGEAIGMTLFTLGLVLWALVPVFDNKHENGTRGRQATYFGIFVVAVLILTTMWGYLGPL
ncbi:MAG: cytochrome bc complex cytochrome b subunit [Fimbriimonadaceae bacterium]|nr:cytochrome bc complex cytochrome b subunit [Fimbriimonadaceae bacterium]QYK55528.1 MAG: cytochrome bc complex cytochrome b subunit [Fimbriimonadaceae bacterium]